MSNNKPANKSQAHTAQDGLPNDVAALKAMLRKEQLKNELLNSMIDIADKELGTHIREKVDAQQSGE